MIMVVSLGIYAVCAVMRLETLCLGCSVKRLVALIVPSLGLLEVAYRCYWLAMYECVAVGRAGLLSAHCYRVVPCGVGTCA